VAYVRTPKKAAAVSTETPAVDSAVAAA
jgi:hypothetical protein